MGDLIANYIMVIKKYAEFSGRSRRREYWLFYLCNLIIAAIFTVLVRLPLLGWIAVIVSSIYSLTILIPGLALTVRRLHDIGKRWTWILINLIPLVGTVLLLVMMAKEGDIGANEFGSDPKLY